MVNKEKLNYFKARENCQSIGGTLFEPQSLSKYRTVYEWAKTFKDDNKWIGITSEDTKWVLDSSGFTVNFQNWDADEPSSENEKCLEIRKDGKWNDENCDSSKMSICEFKNSEIFPFLFVVLYEYFKVPCPLLM